MRYKISVDIKDEKGNRKGMTTAVHAEGVESALKCGRKILEEHYGKGYEITSIKISQWND